VRGWVLSFFDVAAPVWVECIAVDLKSPFIVVFFIASRVLSNGYCETVTAFQQLVEQWARKRQTYGIFFAGKFVADRSYR